MSRTCTVPLLLLALAGPAAAVQTASPTTWTIASGEYTIYGHTDYLPVLTVLPRVVYDTASRLDSARVVDSVGLTRASAAAGLAAGLTGWPAGSYCDGVASATMQTLEPRLLLARIQLAARCGVRLVLVAPRRLLTTNGQPQGVFSVDSARRLTDRYAAVLPADTIRKYRATILGMNLADDYNCTTCWGGRVITQAQIAAWAAYARTRLPGLPLGVRKTPDWVAAYPALAPVLDYTWAQYDTSRGDPQAYYDDAARIASRLGLRVVMGINVVHCYGADSATCTAADLVRLGTLAVTHPASCAFLNWQYVEATWQQSDIRAAWDGLLAQAKARPARECRRGESGA